MAAVCSAAAALANWWMAFVAWHRGKRQAKRDVISRFLQYRYRTGTHGFSRVMCEIPVVFSDVSKVLDIRADLRKIVGHHKRGRVETKDINILLDRLLKAMCKAAALKYPDYYSVEPFASKEEGYMCSSVALEW